MLRRLVEDKHVLAIDAPLSVRATKPVLYRVADANLRFYLAVGRAAHELTSGRKGVQEETLSARCGSFQPGRAKWHVYPSG